VNGDYLLTLYKVHAKGKVSLCRQRRGEQSAPRSASFALGRDPVPVVQKAGWASGPIRTARKISPPTRIRSPDRPERSGSLTDWAIAAVYKEPSEFKESRDKMRTHSCSRGNTTSSLTSLYRQPAGNEHVACTCSRARSHGVTSSHKGQMFVKCTIRGNAALWKLSVPTVRNKDVSFTVTEFW
jgi:hypothetical protein